jgi:electron transport complex protein RnfC
MDVGAVVENVGTCLAIRDAIVEGKPLTERVTTVTGPSIAQPGNVNARIGTSYEELINFCEGFSTKAAKVISGGPMMGFAQGDLSVTTTKTTSGLLALDNKHAVAYDSTPCIACGRCVDACPMGLVPSELSQFMEADDIATAETWDLMDCIECGCCAFECPAHRPLVQHMRRGKSAIMLKRREEKSK